jgi:AraC family transcriptional regulator
MNPNNSIAERRYDEMKVEVKKLPVYTVAYVRVMEGLDSRKIVPAFQKVITWAGARNLIDENTLILGVSLDDPTVTPPEKCRYDACATVPPGTRGAGEVGVYDLPGGDYALYRVTGSYAAINTELERAWQDLMAGWFPESGYQPDDRPCFEIYRETEEEMKAGKYIVDLCESVRPL